MVTKFLLFLENMVEEVELYYSVNLNFQKLLASLKIFLIALFGSN